MGTRKELKVGDLVRVPSKRVAGIYHSFTQGSVVEVVGIRDEYADLTGFSPKAGRVIRQGLRIDCLTFAFQAMQKRDQYKNRR